MSLSRKDLFKKQVTDELEYYLDSRTSIATETRLARAKEYLAMGATIKKKTLGCSISHQQPLHSLYSPYLSSYTPDQLGAFLVCVLNRYTDIKNVSLQLERDLFIDHCITLGANVNVSESAACTTETPLRYAMKNNLLLLIEKLLRAGADFACAPYREDPFYHASGNPDTRNVYIDTITALVNQGLLTLTVMQAETLKINLNDALLSCSSLTGDDAVREAKKYLALGALPDAKHLHYAIGVENFPMVTLLIDQGITLPTLPDDVFNLQCVPILKLLLAQKTPLRECDILRSIDNMLPLCELYSPYLTEKNPSVLGNLLCITTKSFSRYTNNLYQNELMQFIKFCINQGADVNYKIDTHDVIAASSYHNGSAYIDSPVTALYIAMLRSHLELIPLFIMVGADTTFQAADKTTPLTASHDHEGSRHAYFVACNNLNRIQNSRVRAYYLLDGLTQKGSNVFSLPFHVAARILEYVFADLMPLEELSARYNNIGNARQSGRIASPITLFSSLKMREAITPPRIKPAKSHIPQ